MSRGRGRRLRLGQLGERQAARWLRRRGSRILRRNLRLGRREIDLVAETPDGRVVIVVEVKSGDSVLRASGRVDARKEHHVASVASALVRSGLTAGRPLRFDVVLVHLRADGTRHVMHLPGAFESPA